jgi:periplasmic protein TonB
MKPTALLVAVMLLLGGMLFVGCSFNAKEKAVSDTHESELVLPEVSLKKDKTAPILPPVNKQEAPPKAARFELVNTYIKTSVNDGPGTDYGIIPPAVEEDSISIRKDDSITFFNCNLETEAEYPGGLEAWQRFLNKNIKFPTDSIGNGISGTVIVQFAVDEVGNVTDVKAVSGSEPLITEAVRVIKKSSKWTPGRKVSSGRYIKSFKRQPFVFRGE